MYAALSVRTLAGLLFATGLVPRRPPLLSSRAVILTIALLVVLSATTVALADQLPPLVDVSSASVAAHTSGLAWRGLTMWHWGLSAGSLLLTMAALLGAGVYFRGRQLGGWLLVALVLLAGSHLQHMFWPSTYSPVLTSADLLRFGFSAVVAVAGIVELRRIAAERAALLAAEQEQTRRLAELGVLKANFTAMVAHELGSPLGAIRNLAAMLRTGDLTVEDAREALQAIESQTSMLTALVSDVQTAATVERDDFSVRPRPVPMSVLIGDATAFARTLPGNHPLVVTPVNRDLVRADPDRIGQVLRNLLVNASKYSPNGAPIEIRVMRRVAWVHFEVVDHGYGIQQEDLDRIFEKFGRGRDHAGQRVPGVGLGLYLSRRIVRAHGSDLMVASEPGVGSVFGFDLEAMV
jgi:signal transduction histidine kinase